MSTDTIVTIGLAAAAVTAIITAFYAVTKLPPVRWLWRSVFVRAWQGVVSTPLARWTVGVIRPIVEEVVAPVRHAMEERFAAHEETDERIEGKVDTLHDQVEGVHEEVRTGNDAKIGDIIDANEQRRAKEVPHDDRTTAEQHAVDRTRGPRNPDAP